MSWQEYVNGLARSRTNTEIAKLAGITAGNVTKWRNGTQGVDAGVAIRLARAIGDDPLGLLVSLGFLSEAEAKSRPAPAPDLSRLSNDELLELVRSRMSDERVGGEHVCSAPMNEAGGVPVQDVSAETLAAPREEGASPPRGSGGPRRGRA